jgi:hypothetical protein
MLTINNVLKINRVPKINLPNRFQPKKGAKTMTTKLSFLFSFLFLFPIFTATCFSQEREIFVPETELGALFEGATNRILINRNEFETLRRQAREIRLETEQSRNKDKPPAEAVLLSSDYRVEISGLRAVINGTLEIDVLTDDPVSIPLPMERVAVLEAVFDGDHQPVALSENNGQKIVILSGKQRYRLRLRLTTPLEIDATRQRLNFRLIYGTETSFRLSVPGDVELKGGASVLSRKVENGATNFDLLLPPNNNRTEILMSLNSHRKGEYSAVLARSVQFAEVTEHYERLHATVSLSEFHQGVRETSFFVPAGFEITEVQSVFLDRWNVRKSEEKDKRDVLTIHFREQIPGLTTIYLSAIKSAKTDVQWIFPSFEPSDAAVHSAVLGLLLDEDLEMSHVVSNSLFPIDTITLKEAIPPGALELLPGSPTLRLVSAWYAPGKEELNKNVTAKFGRAETDSVIETVQNLILSEKEPVLQYTAKIMPRSGKIFETTLEIPENWNVLNVLDTAGQPLDFRLVNPEKATENVSEKVFGKIMVRFSKGVAARETIQFSLHISGNIRDWFQNGSEKSLQYPVIRIDGSANEQGTISIQNKFEDDWEIIPLQMEHLTALNKNLSFQYLSTPFVLPLRLEKLQPRLKAGTISFYCFEPSLLRVRYEIDYFIEQASVRQLSLLLPASAPPTPSIQGLNGLNIKETLSEETEINGQKFRRWKILFAEPTNGKVRIGVNFEQSIAEQTFTDTAIPFDLPPVIVENTAWQSGLIAVEGDEELDLTIPTERNGKLLLRSVDAGELSVAVYRPGKRLLGVYSVTDSQSPITINVRKNQTTELLSALIRHVFVTARMERTNLTESNTGVLYSVLYEIQTAGGAVNIRTSLNQSDELWSITLDGESIKAQHVGDDILIPISAQNNTGFRRLVLLYRRPALAICDSKNALVLDFPALSLNGKKEKEDEKIPVMQTTWNIIPPFGYEIVRLGGIHSGDSLLQEPSPALFNLFQGTIDFFKALTFRPSKLWNNILSSEQISMTLPKPYYQNNRVDYYQDKNIVLRYESGQNQEVVQDSWAAGGIVIKNQGSLKEQLDVSGTTISGGAIYMGDTVTFDGQYQNSTPLPKSGESPSNSISTQKTTPQSVRRLQSIQPVTVVVSENGKTDSGSSYSVIGNRNTQDIYVQLSSVAVGQHWGWIAFLVVVLIGLLGLRQSRQGRTKFVFGLLILGTFLIFVPGLELFATIFNGIVYGAALIGAVYLGNALWLKLVSIIVKPDISESKISEPRISESKISGTAIVSVFLLMFLYLPVHAAEQNETLPKIQFPDDAIIVPYSPDKISEDSLPDPDNLTLPEQSLLVPYRQYTAILEQLQKRNEKIQNSKNVPNFAVPFAVSAAEYQTVLPAAGNDILLQGKIKIDVFTNQTVLVPLTLENGVFVQPLLDGKPAILQSKSDHQIVLLVEGNGRHELSFDIRVRIQRQGGWRIVTGKLPVAAAAKISLTLPDETGDLLTGNSLDKKKWSFGTNTENTNTTVAKTHEKIIETSLESNGSFHWQWRSAVSAENIDRNLEVDSKIRYDIQEGGVWVRWTPVFRISRGKWEMIRLCLPQDYLIAEIKGENVRGWNIVQENSKTRTIDVELLKPAEITETLSVLLSAPQWFVKPSMTLTLPKLTVPDAGIHQGRIDLFYSSVMNLRIPDSTGLLPADQVVQTESKPVLKFDTISPFDSSLFRSYRFSSENYSLQVELKKAPQSRSLQFFSVLKITRQDVSLETKIRISGNNNAGRNKPFYESIQLPEKFVLKNVNVPDGILWNRKSGDDKENRLNIICPDGHSSVEILIDGDFSGAFSKNRNEIETLPVFKADNINISTRIAVLTEPSLDVRAETEYFRAEIPDSAFSWLSLPEQRELIRIVLRSPALSNNVDGKLILSERKPEIRCSTITNVRTTADAIEETTLLDFDITKAGVRNIEFVLPAWMSNAKIDAPFLRRKTVTSLDTKNTDSPVLVRLELHEEVMEQLRVLVQTDRRLQSETDYHVFVPVIRTGQTIRQYIVMENDRRSPDEMVVDRLQNLHALNRQQSEWSYLASILGGNVTEAYFATKKDNSGNNSSDNAANLLFRMKRRETVQLADARIDLSETRFTLGSNGGYRAEQIYRIDNKKEPYLDLLLPEGASLWGVRILTAAEWQQKEHGEHKNNIGLPVKPNIMPAEIAGRYQKKVTESRLIRIPLVKTESGDVDFIVRLIYAGELQHFSDWARLDIPFIDVLNIPVGESLVRLNLPERYEYQFKGNLQRVRQEQESETIRQVQSNYQRQQTDRLHQAVRGFNPFAAKRAKINLNQLNSATNLSLPVDSSYLSVENSYSGHTDPNSVSLAGGQIIGKGQIITGDKVLFPNEKGKSAQSQDVVPDETANRSSKSSEALNSKTLSSNFHSQSNKFSGQLVQQKALTINKTVNQSATKPSSSFNDHWFTSNSLANPNVTASTEGKGSSIIVTDQTVLQSNVSAINGGGVIEAQPYSVPQQQQQQSVLPQVPQSNSRGGGIIVADTVVPQQQNSAKRNVQIVQGNIVLGKSTDDKTNSTGSTSQLNNSLESPSNDSSSPSQRNELYVRNEAYQGGGLFKNEFGRRNSTLGQSVNQPIFSIEDKSTDQPIFSIDTKTFPLEPTPIPTNRNNNSTAQLGMLVRFPDNNNDVQERSSERQQQSDKPESALTRTGSVSVDTYGRAGQIAQSEKRDIIGNGGFIITDSVTPTTEQSSTTDSNTETTMVVASGRFEVSGTVEQILPALSTRTSSLDIEIPYTGKTFLFTASQGSLDLSFRAISNRTGSRGFQMLLSFFGLAFLYGIYRLCFSIGNRLTFDRRTHRNIAGLVTLLGILSLILAPFVSVLSFIFAAILWVTLLQRKSTT